MSASSLLKQTMLNKAQDSKNTKDALLATDPRLLDAVIAGDLMTIKSILANEGPLEIARTNRKSSHLKEQNALHIAADLGLFHICEILVANICGREILDDLDSHNMTALFYAVKNGNMELMKLFIEAGASFSVVVKVEFANSRQIIHAFQYVQTLHIFHFLDNQVSLHNKQAVVYNQGGDFVQNHDMLMRNIFLDCEHSMHTNACRSGDADFLQMLLLKYRFRTFHEAVASGRYQKLLTTILMNNIHRIGHNRILDILVDYGFQQDRWDKTYPYHHGSLQYFAEKGYAVTVVDFQLPYTADYVKDDSKPILEQLEYWYPDWHEKNNSKEYCRLRTMLEYGIELDSIHNEHLYQTMLLHGLRLNDDSFFALIERMSNIKEISIRHKEELQTAFGETVDRANGHQALGREEEILRFLVTQQLINIKDDFNLVESLGHCVTCNSKLLQLLIDLGARLDIPIESGETSDCVSPLMWEARALHVENVKILLTAGASVHAFDKISSQTALHYAVKSARRLSNANCIEVIRLLLQAGADPYAKDGQGKNALETLHILGRQDVLDAVGFAQECSSQNA